MKIYLDNAATTKISDEVIGAITQTLFNSVGNPSSQHFEGRNSKKMIENSRRLISEKIGCAKSEIVFTSGGSESNNMILTCAVRDLSVERIITSKIEHKSILKTLESMNSIVVSYVSTDKQGRIKTDELEALLESSKLNSLVTLMHSNNEIGTMLDLKKVGGICKKYNALFHSDAVQTIGHFPIDISDFYISFLSASAHKFHGPKGIGFVYINSQNKIDSFIKGGGQESKIRSGTENVHGIVGLAKALDLASESFAKNRSYILSLKNHLKNRLITEFSDIQINGSQDILSHHKILNVSFPKDKNSKNLLISLDLLGICVSGGSACSSNEGISSHVLEEIGIKNTFDTIRFSFSHYNTIEELDFVVEQLKSLFRPEKYQRAY